MIVTGLHLSRLRAIETAEFTFRRGFNLVVGVNGVGKSTVLDALCVCMSRVLPKATGIRGKPRSFRQDDIRGTFPFLEATMFLELGGQEFQYSRLEQRDTVAKDDPKNVAGLRREILDAERLRDRPRKLLRSLAESQDLPDSDNFAPAEPAWRKPAMSLSSSPLGVFFSTNRSVLTARTPATSKSRGGKFAAYADALVARPWNFRELADWMKVQLVLSKEIPIAGQHLAALQNAVRRFLPDCTGLRPGDGEESTLVLEKAGTPLDVRQLSDGERGVLSMVLDLSRRLSQANEGASDPLGEGQAVVLIDEIDLHLHPKWQRQIVRNLTTAFPCCQFIATTHSPQVIGEVDHDRIQIISDGQVYSPTHSYGVDSSRILEEVMETPSRDPEVSLLQSKIHQAIGRTDFREARELLGKLIDRLELREGDPDVTHLRTLIDFAEGNE